VNNSAAFGALAHAARVVVVVALHLVEISPAEPAIFEREFVAIKGG
jgi:hypothetical protein